MFFRRTLPSALMWRRGKQLKRCCCPGELVAGGDLWCGCAGPSGHPQTHAQGFLFTWKSRNLPQQKGKQEANVTASSGCACEKSGPGCRGLCALIPSAHSSFLDACDSHFLEHGQLTSPSPIGMNESTRRLGSRAKDARESDHLGCAACWTFFPLPGLFCTLVCGMDKRLCRCLSGNS